MMNRAIANLSLRQLSQCSLKRYSSSSSDSQPLSKNDVVSPNFQNRNPMNLEKIRIGMKPSGFTADLDRKDFWNGLKLSISTNHTTATVTHWTGRKVCSASTQEWAIQKFLYNNSDLAALKIVGKVLGNSFIYTK